MAIAKNGYYTLRDILGYSDCTYFIVLSDRGRGKSWSAKWFFLEQPGEVMCVTRQIPDMRHQIKDFIDPFLEGDAEHEAISPELFKWEGSDQEGWTLLYNGNPKFYFRTLTMTNAIKQEVFPQTLNWVFVDEFIPLVYKKIGGIESEGDALRTIMKTIDHDTAHSRESKGLKPLRCLMYANPFTWNNPILSYFHINGMLGPGIHRAGPGVVWEMLQPYTAEKHEKPTVDDFLGDEVYKNMGFLDQSAFLASPPNGARPFISIRLERQYFHIYSTQNAYYVTPSNQHFKALHRMGTLEGLQEEERCLDHSKQLDWIKDCIYSGMLRYDNINTKFDFINGIYNVK